MLTSKDTKDNTTTYVYDARGFLEKTVDPKGSTAAYYYDLAGRKVAQVTPKNYDLLKTLSDMNRTEYVYDLMGRVLTKIAKYRDPVSGTWVTINIKSYKYDNQGNVIKELDALGFESGIGYSLNEKIESGYGTVFTYNPANKLASETDSLGSIKTYDYDGLGRKAAETDSRGVITGYTYDDDGNITKVSVRKTAGSTEVITKQATYDLTGKVITSTDGNGNTTTYEYNAFGRERKVISPGDSTIHSNTVTYQYDVLGNLKKQKDSDGTVDLYTYDRQNRVLSHTEQKQDGSGEIKTSARYDKNGNKRFETDGNGYTKEMTYDSLDKLISEKITVTNADNRITQHITTYVYDADRNLISETDFRGNTKTNIYDPINRLIEKKDAYGKSIQKIEYNKNSAQTKSCDALGNVTEYSYDKIGRLLSTKDPQGHVTSQSYDGVGNITSKTDGRGNTTTFEYDELNRLVSVINPPPKDAGESEVTSYTYDNNGNILTQTDGKGNVTTFQYNPMNKTSKRIDGTLSDSSNTESYTYYANGMLKTKKDRKGVTTTYTYDSHRRLIKETSGTESIVYVYDNKGNQISVEDSTGKTLRTFDEMNRVKTKTVPYIGTTVFVYDIIEGTEIGCTSEKVKDPKGNITLREYDRAGRIKKVTADGKTTSYTYYDNGSKQSTIYPDGSSEEYTYYKDNLLKTLTNRKSDGSVIETYSYSYDSAHNQITKVDRKGTTNYTYDRLNRLETVKEPDGKLTSYKYDKASNRIEETASLNNNIQSTTYQYDSKNRLTGTITKTGNTDEITKYLYDNNGNLIIKSRETIKPLDQLLYPVINAVKIGKDKDDITKYTAFYEYDSFNRMISTTTEDKTILYKYNSEGYRVEKTVNGSVTRYLYEGDKVILEVDGAGNLTAKNVYGANLAARTTEGKTFYYMYNGHGDVTALIDSTGIVATYYYDAFGNIQESGGDVNNPYRYAGYEYDDETGCYYLKARYYDPEIARFLSEDTYRGRPDDPLSLNLYTYCHNEPIMYTDPTGHVAVYGNTTDIKNAQEAWGYEGFTYYDTSEKYVDPWDIPADAIIVGGAGADRGVAENPNNALRIWGVDRNATAEAIIRYKPSNDFNSSASRIDYYMGFGGMSGYQGMGKAQNKSLIADLGSGIRKIATTIKDFGQGIGAGVLESLTYGVSRDMDVYFDRDNEVVYLVGKAAGNTVIGVLSTAGATASSGLTFVTSPTGAGALAFGSAAVYCVAVSFSAAGNLAANVTQIVNITQSGGSSSGGQDIDSTPNEPNPYGAPGKPDHVQSVDDLSDLAHTKYSNPDKYIIHHGTSIKNQPNTKGLDRRPDVWIEDKATGRVVEVFEAGRETANGVLALREVLKIKDYKNYGIPYTFKLLPK